MKTSEILNGLSLAIKTAKKARALMVIDSSDAEVIEKAVEIASRAIGHEGALVRLQAMESNLRQSAERIEELKQRKRIYCQGFENDERELMQILNAVAKVFRLEPGVVLGKKRYRGTVVARQLAIYISRKLTDLSVTRLGRFYNRDHSTVCFTINKVEDMLSQRHGNVYDKYLECLNELEKVSEHDTKRKELAADTQLNKAG